LKKLDLKISLMAFLGFDVVFFHSLLKKVEYFLRSNQKRAALEGSKARSKRRILHAPNQIIELHACKMQRLYQLNSTGFN
jgi:hypothetical protein